MYLKSIELQGFKSFADKTKVVFDRGVTAVVGPNGSGKSNITESLRWALGESSAKSLRGGKMPDVIFAGTESRKALNYASVIVTLDNSNGFLKGKGEEVRVERHIYRSGDSEYRIDGQKVRLKDIHDLFMDTGLGRDSFSIISQGRVEEIFNSKPEERRAIFEEAAGVLKYKTRKKETESKLNQTQENLDRLEDIIYELDQQVKPLENQAQTAKRFLELDEKRKSLYLDVLVARLEEGRSQLAVDEAALSEAKNELSSYYQERDRLEVENQALKEKRQSLQNEMQENNRLLLELTKLMSDLEGTVQLRQLESSQREQSKQEAQERRQQVQQELTELSNELEEVSQRLQAQEEDLAAIKGKISQKQVELEQYSEDVDTVVERLREQYVQLLQDEAKSSNRLTKIEQEIEVEEARSASQQEELSHLMTLQARLTEDEAAGKLRLEEAQQSLRTLLDRYQDVEGTLHKEGKTYQESQSALFDLLDQIKAKRARQSSLEAIQKNHSNFYAGVKAVLQAKDRLPGIVGAVSEQVTFSADYQTAMEVALGGASQHVIVQDEATAKAAIRYLKQQRAGRATFLPLTTIKPRVIASHHLDQLKKSPGYLGTAASLVSYDPRLSAIFENLLGAVAIFETIEEANQAARATRFQVRMVTLDGSEIRPGGSFAGGASRNQSTTFIKPELDQLSSELAALSRESSQKESQVAAAKEALDARRASLDAIKTEGEEARLAEQEARLQLEQIQSRLSDVTLQVDAQKQLSGLANLADLQAEATSIQGQLNDYQDKKQSLEEEIEAVKDNREIVQEKRQTLQDELSQLKLQEAQWQSEHGFSQTTQKRLQEEVASAQEQSELLTQLIEEQVDLQPEQTIDYLEEQLADAKERHAQANQALIRLRFEEEDVQGQLEDLAEHAEVVRKRNEELIRQQTRLESQVEQGKSHLRQLVMELTEHFSLSFEAAKEKAQTLEELALAEQELKEIERAIRALGPINLDAIEQYDQVHSRLTFLTTQREDVLKARQLLLDTIHEMDAEVTGRFQATFEAIRESFQYTFKQMFGGGSADLLLTSSDLLTTGVEISVQPPGKKIQSLNLMSGGEKALSALALLFSIIRVKTIPFVILDEVEAALDEANVKRFGDYLNRFDQSSQFIVVTHRKGTMAAADAMYGVTMQESGVSKIVSVKLKDLDEFH